MKNISLARASSKITIRLILWAIAIMIVVPFLPVLIWSFTQKWFWPDLLPEKWGVRSWTYVFSSHSQVGSAILTTLILGILVTFITLVISLPAAKAIGQREFKGKSFLEILLLAPYLVSPTAVAMGLYSVFIQMRLNATVLGVVLAMLISTTPMMVRMLTSVFESLDPNYEEQARSLGANSFQIITRVTIPIIIPGIVAGSLFTFLTTLNAFFYPYMIGSGKVMVLSVLLFNFLGKGGYDLPITSALSIILAIPGIIFLLFSEKLIKEEYFAMGFGH
jgi:putative spermidine/putrescine transport system permease protein